MRLLCLVLGHRPFTWVQQTQAGPVVKSVCRRCSRPLLTQWS